MKLILVGCEYAGKTTLANAIVGWIERTFGSSRTFHDHFSLPCNEFPVEEQEQLLGSQPAAEGDVPALHDELPLSFRLLQRPGPQLGGFPP